jgi:hypothetical protein
MVSGATVERMSFFQDLLRLCECCGLLPFNVKHAALQSALMRRAVRTSMKDPPIGYLQASR